MKPLIPVVNSPTLGLKYQCQLDWPEDAEIRCSYENKVGLEAVCSENPDEPNCRITAWLPVPADIPATDYWKNKALHRCRFSVMGGSSGDDWVRAEERARECLVGMQKCDHAWRNTGWNLTGDGTCVNCHMFVHGMFMDKGLQNSMLLAYRAHEGVNRKWSSSPYIVHPQEVYERINWWRRDLPMDQWLRMAKAAWLHDVVEDCPDITPEAIIEAAGEDSYKLVLELTNPSKQYASPYAAVRKSRSERKQMDRNHLKTVSWEAKVIKFYDRTCNLTDLQGCHDKGFLRLYTDESQLMWDEVFAQYRKGSKKDTDHYTESFLRDIEGCQAVVTPAEAENIREDAFIDRWMERYYLSWLEAARKRSV